MDQVVGYLRCPVCAQPLRVTGTHTLGCPARHSFDVARQGYVDLAPGPLAHTGDTAEMVAARAEFLDRGHYDAVSAALAAAVPAGTGELVVDAG
ncbi:MAG TPA: 23S rRNA methyltransferase, partial [Rugosimonospora sp.]|nr:23S rRNA methyltransferase [Rugosimonospora sp.]